MKFSHKIVLSSAILLLLTISFLSINQYFTVNKEVRFSSRSSVSDILNSVSNNVAAELDGRKTLARFISNLIDQNPNKQGIEKVIQLPALKAPFLLVGGGLETDGRAFTSDPSWDPGSSWDARVRPWYKDAKAKNDLIVTAPYADSVTKEILISIATPITENGRFIGATFYDVSLASLADIVNNVELFDAGYLFIVDQQGTTIAHPDKEKNGESFTSYEDGITIKEGIQNKLIDGEEYSFSFVKVPNSNWYVGAKLEQRVVLQTIYQIRDSSIIYTIIALIVSTALLLFVITKLMSPLGELNGAINDVASGQGDLTQRLDTNTDPEFASLAKGFNQFSSSLQSQITQLKDIGSEVFRGVSLASESTLSSKAAMESQLQEVEQLATAMNEMSVTSHDMAGNAQSAAAFAQEADNATNQGSEVVDKTTSSISLLSDKIDQAVTEVQMLEEATGSIETVLQVINDIADQTNLLALNAAIEAARAGEQGRGFAVVADEVRSLAQRTQESTTEIRTMIEQLQAGTASVASAMGQSKDSAQITVENAEMANASLEKIREAIQKISDMNLQIASAAEEQSLVAEEINTNTTKIKDLSMQVTEEASTASLDMQAQAENIREQNQILDKFIV